MRKIITQYYTPEISELFGLTSTVNQAYATKNGYEYITNNTLRCPTRAKQWEKIAWIINLLSTVEDGSLVVFEDCDSLNLNGDISNMLPSGSQIGMVQIRGGNNGEQPMSWYNSGVIAMINSQTLRDFWNRVWTRNDILDEDSIVKELKSNSWTIGNGYPIYGMDPSWNCWNNNAKLVTTINIKSWHSMSYANKLASIKEFLNKN